MNFEKIPTDAELVTATLHGSKTGSLAASEDIAQETFLSAWKNLAALRAPENFRGWLCGTVRHLAAKFHGRRETSVPLTDEIPAAPSEEIMSREEEAMLWATLEQLPEDYREPLVLFHRGGQSVREIASGLGLSEDAVKQRLSRGRAMLQEAVRGKVETALTRSRPGAAFTIAVLAAIPALTTSAQAAGAGLATAKGVGAFVAPGFSAALGGTMLGLLGAWQGTKYSLESAESERERRFIRRVARWAMATTVVFLAALFALIFLGNPLLRSQPALWIALMAIIVVGYSGIAIVFSAVNGRIQNRIRAEERRRRGDDASPVPSNQLEYRSRLTFLGLPLVHLCFSGSDLAVAKGWIAYGPVAIGPLFAFGGIAIGGVAVGGLSLGLLTMAGIGVGLLSFSGLAAGGIAIGGLALGGIAMGGAACGWLAAFGGQAWAGTYALGRQAAAPHANDAVAKAFFVDHGLLQAVQWIVEHALWVQAATFLPILLTIVWIQKLRRNRQKVDRGRLSR
jgi:RNA polymerase sigma factor (sigma-70 family)